jgi:hypothetical protein
MAPLPRAARRRTFFLRKLQGTCTGGEHARAARRWGDGTLRATCPLVATGARVLEENILLLVTMRITMRITTRAPSGGDGECPGGNPRAQWRPTDMEAGAGWRGGADGRKGIHTPSISAENADTSAPSGQPPPTMPRPSTQRSGRHLSPRR